MANAEESFALLSLLRFPLFFFGKGVGETIQFKGLPPEYGELEELKPLAKSRDKFDQRLAERRYEQVLKKLGLLPEE